MCGFLALRRITRQQAARFHLHQVLWEAEDGAVDVFDDHDYHDDDDDCDDGQSVVMGSPASAAEPWPGGLQQPCLCADAGRG